MHLRPEGATTAGRAHSAGFSLVAAFLKEYLPAAPLPAPRSDRQTTAASPRARAGTANTMSMRIGSRGQLIVNRQFERFNV